MNWGWDSISHYLEAVMVKDPEKMTYGERKIFREQNELLQIKEEIIALDIAQSTRKHEEEYDFNDLFPMDDKLKNMLKAEIDYIKKFRTFNMEDVYYFCKFYRLF